MLGRSRNHPISLLGWRGALLALALFLLLLAPARSWATTIVVTTTTDENNSDGDCSLREAIRAANGNAARDACPAGSATQRDTVTLASGATYSLTIAPVNGDVDALNGDLDIANNNSASQDLLIDVADGGTATISQDAFPDDVVIDLGLGASVEIDGVLIRGGTASPGAGGAGISIPINTTLALKRCTLVDNVAPNNGGAIVVGSNSTLTMEDCVVADNVALSSAGGILTGGGSTTTISGTLFQNNVAQQQSGGAIRNTGTLIVTSSSFVDNRAKSLGGAIANSANGTNAIQITSSCFVGNGDIAVDSFTAQAQLATNSWWGASDGPSGSGPGSGDSVGSTFVFTGFTEAPPAGCGAQELVANGGFELDDDGNGLPERWNGRRLDGAGTTCGGGECTFDVSGNGARQQLLQTLDLAGEAGDTFTLSAVSSASGVPTSAGRYLVELQLVHTDGSKQVRSIKFSPGNHGAEERSKKLVAAESYLRLKVRIEYGRASGEARFDDVSVVRE